MGDKVSPTRNSVWYWCPGCLTNHRITLSGSVAWTWDCDTVRPTFSPSVLVNGSVELVDGMHRCHHFVRGGQIVYLDDCTHELRGKTVEMEDF